MKIVCFLTLLYDLHLDFPLSYRICCNYNNNNNIQHNGPISRNESMFSICFWILDRLNWSFASFVYSMCVCNIMCNWYMKFHKNLHANTHIHLNRLFHKHFYCFLSTCLLLLSFIHRVFLTFLFFALKFFVTNNT